MESPIRTRLDQTVRIKCLDIPLHHHHYLVLNHLFRWMRKVALPEAHGILLDYGCGGRPYEELFSQKVDQYIGADVATAADTQVDVLLEPDRPVPLSDASIDTVLANQTLEHVPDPSFYVSECARLLKPGGVLILTAPMQWRHHEEPYDYHRFTRFGIERLLKLHGLELRDLRPCGGAYALIGQIWLGFLFRSHPKPQWFVKMVNRLFLWLDSRYPDSGETINWMCIARKPSPPTPESVSDGGGEAEREI